MRTGEAEKPTKDPYPPFNFIHGFTVLHLEQFLLNPVVGGTGCVPMSQTARLESDEEIQNEV